MWDTKLAFKRLGCTPAFTDLASEVFALIVTPHPLYVALCGLVQMGRWPCVTPPIPLLAKYLCNAFIMSHTLTQNIMEHSKVKSDTQFHSFHQAIKT